MKKLMLSLVLICGPVIKGKESPSYITKALTKKQHFLEVYKNIRKWEGNYAYHPYDKGGETYGGIARKYSPDWYGWRHVDKFKKQSRGRLNNNQKIDDAEFWVQDWYLDVWVKEGFYEIKDYELAKTLFDLRINSGKYMCKSLTQKALNRANTHIILEDDEKWIPTNELNKYKNTKFLTILIKDERIKLFYIIVKNNDTQKVFLNGWIRRTKNI